VEHGAAGHRLRSARWRVSTKTGTW
jgi:hypothetical protein